jgi:hypothetical protein
MLATAELPSVLIWVDLASMKLEFIEGNYPKSPAGKLLLIRSIHDLYHDYFRNRMSKGVRADRYGEYPWNA